MTPEELYQQLKPLQEKIGYCFNPNKEWTLQVLTGLLTNQERYGYSSCPCRLAFGQREKDQAIICPCTFREEDVSKYDRCYCALYLSREATQDAKILPKSVPERWLR